jgi:hypothetical protein
MCMSSPSVPSYTPEPSPAPVQQSSSAQKRSRDEAAEKAREAAGLAGTVTTTPSGLATAATTVKKTLLGQ